MRSAPSAAPPARAAAAAAAVVPPSALAAPPQRVRARKPTHLSGPTARPASQIVPAASSASANAPAAVKPSFLAATQSSSMRSSSSSSRRTAVSNAPPPPRLKRPVPDPEPDCVPKRARTGPVARPASSSSMASTRPTAATASSSSRPTGSSTRAAAIARASARARRRPDQPSSGAPSIPTTASSSFLSTTSSSAPSLTSLTRPTVTSQLRARQPTGGPASVHQIHAGLRSRGSTASLSRHARETPPVQAPGPKPSTGRTRPAPKVEPPTISATSATPSPEPAALGTPTGPGSRIPILSPAQSPFRSLDRSPASLTHSRSTPSLPATPIRASPMFNPGESAEPDSPSLDFGRTLRAARIGRAPFHTISRPNPSRPTLSPGLSASKTRSMTDLRPGPTHRTPLAELPADFASPSAAARMFAARAPPTCELAVVEDAPAVDGKVVSVMEHFVNGGGGVGDSFCKDGMDELMDQADDAGVPAVLAGMPRLSPRIAPGENDRVSPVKPSVRRLARHTMSPQKATGWTRAPTKVSSTLSPITQSGRLTDTVLRGAVVFLDVYDNDGTDAGHLFRPLLDELGARCVDAWTNSRAGGVTHVLFKDGEMRTLEKVVAAAGAVKCVNIGWPLDCERAARWLDETPYLLDLTRLALSSGRAAPSSGPIGEDRFDDKENRAVVMMPVSPVKVAGYKIGLEQTSPGQSGEDENDEMLDQLDQLSIQGSPCTPSDRVGQPVLIEQKTCPGKQQTLERLFGDVDGDEMITPFQQRLRGRRSFGLEFIPRVPSPLRRGDEERLG